MSSAAVFNFTAKLDGSESRDEFDFRISVHIWAVVAAFRRKFYFLELGAAERFPLMKRWDVEFRRVHCKGHGANGVIKEVWWQAAKAFVDSHANPAELIIPEALGFGGCLIEEVHRTNIRVQWVWYALDNVGAPPAVDGRREVVGLSYKAVKSCDAMYPPSTPDRDFYLIPKSSV